MFSEFEVYWVLYFDDFPQRGINKLQKHSQLRYNRPEAAVEVLCHCVVYENDHDLDDQVFKDAKIAPSANDWHPLFRPVSEDFFRIFKIRIKLDEDLGQKVIWTILNQFLTEVSEDVKSGEGQSSLTKLLRLKETNSGKVPKLCSKCQYKQDYDENTHNVCISCGHNPNVYQNSEPNPYTKFGIKPGKFRPVVGYEQEPLQLNPSSVRALIEFLDHIHVNQTSKGDKASAVGLDSLPGIRIKGSVRKK